jgi:hypothetical protein
MIIKKLDAESILVESQQKKILLESNKPDNSVDFSTYSVPQKINEKDPLKILTYSGEYEINDFMIKAYSANNGNTFFIIKTEEITLAHFGQTDFLDEETLDKLDNLDILILPIKEDLRNEKETLNLIKKLDPKVLVPLGDYQAFLENFGETSEPTTKYKISKSNLELEKMEIVILEEE